MVAVNVAKYVAVAGANHDAFFRGAVAQGLANVRVCGCAVLVLPAPAIRLLR